MNIWTIAILCYIIATLVLFSLEEFCMLNRLYGWYGKRVVHGALAVLVVLSITGVYVVSKNSGTDDSTAVETKKPSVTLRAVGALQGESAFSVVGTVRAVSEAKLQAEANGRITSVPVNIGDTVGAGTILGTLENSSERASLLQAEGAYESALASSRGGDVDLVGAKTSVRNTYRTAFATTEGVVRNLVDEFFSNPTSGIVGFKLDGGGDAPQINATRVEIETILTAWSLHIADDFTGLTEEEMLADATEQVTFVNNFVTQLALIVSEEDPTSQFTEEDLAAYETRLATARASLDGTLATISGVRNAYEQAQISGAAGTDSQSEARIKSALGTLRAAQANYEKTLVRTPISGVVNALYLTVGEYAAQGQPAAVVANNGSLEVSTALGESDLDTVVVGDVVTINESATGTITTIAPAVDPLTGKAEVKISVDGVTDVKNGSTVTVAFVRNTDVKKETQRILIPLAALKLLPSGPIAFGVHEDGVLVAYPVTLGEIMGDTVEIIDGLTSASIIVTDARGLRAGDSVDVIQK